MRDKELCEYQGKLALYFGAWPDRNEPKIITSYFVSNIPAADYTHLLGAIPWFSNGLGYAGLVKPVGAWNDTVIDVHDWSVVHVDQPIAKPRDGKDYTWGYSEYEWRRAYFPRCPECYNYHNPSWQPCDLCGYCHKPGSRCKAEQ